MLTDQFNIIQLHVYARLNDLSSHLTYHDRKHTADVIQQSARIAMEEGVLDETELYLLKIAALYHDTGFLRTYKGHEKESCLIFLEDQYTFKFSEKDQVIITDLINVTQLPQKPTTTLEKIICDADLDYLGRDDFFVLAGELKKEFLHFNVVSDDKEWETLQINFLTSHSYHTQTSQNHRNPVKQQHYSRLIK